MKIIKRQVSNHPPRFKPGIPVAFEFNGDKYAATFVRAYSPDRRAGLCYELEIEGEYEVVFANGKVGRTVTAQAQAQAQA